MPFLIWLVVSVVGTLCLFFYFFAEDFVISTARYEKRGCLSLLFILVGSVVGAIMFFI